MASTNESKNPSRRVPKAPRPTQPAPRVKHYPPLKPEVMEAALHRGQVLEERHPLGASQENLTPANEDHKLNFTEMFTQDLPRNPHLIQRIARLDLLPPEVIHRIPMPPDFLDRPTTDQHEHFHDEPERKSPRRKQSPKKSE